MSDPLPSKNNKFRQCKDCPLQAGVPGTVAKAGMAASLGATVASGILKFKGAKPLHFWASVAFVGFTLIHYTIHKKSQKIAK